MIHDKTKQNNTRRPGQSSRNDWAYADRYIQNQISERELDDLLREIVLYFRDAEQYRIDMTRGLKMFDPGCLERRKDELDKKYWFSFWSFFLFDYRMLKNGRTPIQNYLTNEGRHMDTGKAFIIRELAMSRLSVFFVKKGKRNRLICQDLLTKQEFEVYCRTSEQAEKIGRVFYAHIHNDCSMLFRYIASVPLIHGKKFVEDRLMQMHRMFKFCRPEATAEDFYRRQAAAIRYVVMNGDECCYEALSQEMCRRCRKTAEELKAVSLRHIVQYAKIAGLSKNSTAQLVRMFNDYGAGNNFEVIKKGEIAAFIVALAFINGGNKEEYESILETLHISDKEAVYSMSHNIVEKLGCCRYDGRYLTDEGAVKAFAKERGA